MKKLENTSISEQANMQLRSGDDEEPEPLEPEYWPYTWNPTYYVVAAICGNWWQESTLNPGLYEGRKVVPLTDNNVYGGYGLGQWTNSPKHKVYRRTALANWLYQNGWNYTSPVGQLLFFLEENVWYKTAQAADFASLTDFMQSQSNDIEYLTYAFMRGWEGIWDGTQGIRVQAAENIYNKFYEEWPDLDKWYISNQYLSNNQRYHNAYMICEFMEGEEVPGNTPVRPPIKPPASEKRPGMRIWQMIRYH